MSERAINRKCHLIALPGYKGPMKINYQGEPGLVTDIGKLRAFGNATSAATLQSLLNGYLYPYGGKASVSGYGTQAAPWKITAPEGLTATGPAEIIFSMLPLGPEGANVDGGQ